jgi:tRNA-splicing ligase RtcB
MAGWQVRGKELRQIGYPEGPVISIAMNIIQKAYKHSAKEGAMHVLKEVLTSPAEFVNDETLGPIAKQLLPKEPKSGASIQLNEKGIDFRTFGAQFIEESAFQQMHQASRLPISVGAALMPDAHAGYGLPIGGVLATENAVIPFGVGVDIGCRMCMSIFPIDPKKLAEKEQYFKRELLESTLFGSGQQFEHPADHPIMEHRAFDELPVLAGLQQRAWKQLGTSGSGNHFAEFGIVEIGNKDEIAGIEAGQYVALLSHSGSRALGANVANYYTKIAKEKRQLPGEASDLAWLSLDEQEGIEYWIAMNLAGDYASACHHIIHEKIAKQLGESPLKMIENHHNFAWKEIHEGKEVIVHRKGATPAGKDVLGIIPGSMTDPGFIVKGKGYAASLDSASHGAGRRMSRTKAINSITSKDLKQILDRHGVVLIGGGLDEAPQAYKNIADVMKSQEPLVDVVGKFIPKIVRMDGTPPRQRKMKNKEVVWGD